MKRTPRRPFFLFWILGLAALVASTTGAIFALHKDGLHKDGKAANGATPPAESVAAAPPSPGGVFQGTLDIEGGVTPLYPVQPGRVREVLVHENDKVKAGDVLLRLDDRFAKQRWHEAKADYEAAEAQLEQAQVLPQQQQYKTSQQQAAIDAMKADLAMANLTLERKREQVVKGNLNKLEADITAQMVEKLKAGVQSEEEKFRELKLLDPQLQINRARADVDAKRAKMEQAQIGLDECLLKAPADGQVLQILVSPGSVFGTQSLQPAVQFLPDKPQIVRAEVEQEFASRIKIGQTAIIQDEHGGKEKWTGKVVRLSNWYTQRRASQPDAIRIPSNDIRTLECIIVLDANQQPLRVGQRVRAIVGRE